jgi:phenylacetic acid degradation operon negative regulatory protein
MSDELPAQRGGAKALLLTVLGEFVLPAGGSVWTSSLVTAAAALGIGEKNARQAIARIGDQGLIEPDRQGRKVRWSLTPDGRELLESGTRRIYGFARAAVDWNGEWVLAHCRVGETQRAVRDQLRIELRFLGFGELSASLLISPHTSREPELRQILNSLDLQNDSVVLKSTTGSAAEDADLVARAWDLEELASSYVAFCRAHGGATSSCPEAPFRAIVELVHDWRRFPFTDPELPTELLPPGWSGTAAAEIFHRRHAELSAAAVQWFAGP